MTELASNPYQLDLCPEHGWMVGILMADGNIAINPESPLHPAREAQRIAEARCAAKPFMRFVAIESAPGGGRP